MGYRRQSPLYNLIFEGDFEGLRVQVKGLSVGELLDLTKRFAKVEQGAQAEEVEAIFVVFGKKLLGWNLEDEDGKPVPPTVAGMRGQDLDLVLAVISHWIEAVSGVSSDLGKDSTSGGTSQELQLPMEDL